jgi:hypothetical protein
MFLSEETSCAISGLEVYESDPGKPEHATKFSTPQKITL